MRNMAVLHSPAFSYPLPVLVRVLSNLLIFKGKILYYNKDSQNLLCPCVFPSTFASEINKKGVDNEKIIS